jgi:hypothetical protein
MNSNDSKEEGSAEDGEGDYYQFYNTDNSPKLPYDEQVSSSDIWSHVI